MQPSRTALWLYGKTVSGELFCLRKRVRTNWLEGNLQMPLGSWHLSHLGLQKQWNGFSCKSMADYKGMSNRKSCCRSRFAKYRWSWQLQFMPLENELRAERHCWALGDSLVGFHEPCPCKYCEAQHWVRVTCFICYVFLCSLLSDIWKHKANCILFHQERKQTSLHNWIRGMCEEEEFFYFSRRIWSG